MKVMNRILVFCVVVLILLTGCAKNMVMIDETMNGEAIELENGEKFIISLPGNPTTGYNWELINYDDQIIRLVGEPDFQPDSRALGAGGMFFFTFEAINPGETTVALFYHRSWETDVPPEKEFSVFVNVPE